MSALTENMHVECAIYPAELSNSYNVKCECEFWTKYCCFSQKLCEFCYMDQIYDSTIFVGSKNYFDIRTMLISEVC